MGKYYDSVYLPGVNMNMQYDRTKNSLLKKTFDVPLFDFSKSQKNDKLFPFIWKNNISLDLSPTNQEKIAIPKVGSEKKPFESKTQSLMYKTQHKTKLLDIAQNHLGYQEVSNKEYPKLPQSEKDKTQMHFIGKYGNPNHQWCAHAVSHLSEEAGMNIGGHKMSVQQYINWARNKGYYHPIETNTATVSNYKLERKQRAVQIKEQFKKMKEGDFVIWKSSYVAELPNREFKNKNSSHIGILESVNEDGTITVIEGNANEFLTENAEREIVKTQTDGIIGAQDIGDFKEVNKRDGLIRKTYTAENLASFGYAGYIDTQEIIK